MTDAPDRVLIPVQAGLSGDRAGAARRNWRGYATAAATVLALAALWLTMSRRMSFYDEAIPLVGAMRVLAGDVPHRDFYSAYGPAPYYLLAGLFKLFGPGFLAERLYDTVIKAGVIGLFFHVAAAQARLWLALAATAAVTVWLIAVAAYAYVIYPVLFLGMGATWLLVPREDGSIGLGRAAAAGALTGAMALFRYDVAGFLLVVHALAVAVLVSRRPGGIRAFLGIGAAYGLGCALVFAPAAILFWIHAPLQSFLFDIFGFNAGQYAAMRRLPWPGPARLLAHPEDAAVYLPFCALGASIVFLARRRGEEQAEGASRTYAVVLLFSALAAAFVLKGLVRVSVLHMLMAIVVGVLLLTVIAEDWLRRGRSAARLGVAAVGVVVALLAVSSLRLYPRAPLLLRPPAGFVDMAAVAPGALRPPYGEAARFVAAETSPSERIFVGRLRHDRVPYNALIVYFAAQRLPATRWHQFDAGLQSGAEVQREMIADLERGRVRWLILDSIGDDVREPNASARSSGVTLLDDYIRRNYRLRRDWGVAQAWSRVS